MFSSVGANSQIITSLASEAASVVNHLKNVAVTGCTTCNQQRRWFNHQSQQQETSQSHQTQQQEHPEKLHTDSLRSCHKALCDELGLNHLPENWIDSLSLLSINPVHTQTGPTSWRTSHTSSESFFENKHGFSKHSQHQWEPKFQLFHTGNTRLPWKYTKAMIPKTLIRQFHSLERIQHLEDVANSDVDNGQAQALYLQAVAEQDPEYVIRRYESGKFATNEFCRRIYMKALERTVDIKEEAVEGEDADQSGHSENTPVYIKNIVNDDSKGSFFANGLYTVKYIAARLLILLLIISIMEVFVENKVGIVKFDVKPEDPKKQVKFSDVQGANEAKEELQDLVEFLKNPEKFQVLGGKMPTGVLLTGPPGVGKTLLAKAVAGEADVPFFYASGSEFEEMFVGVGASRIRKLFDEAKNQSPSIIFIDEIDAIGGRRVENDHQPHARMTMNQLLVELDGFDKNSTVVVIAATNFPASLDKALTRPGRFDSKVTIAAPVAAEREAILELYVGKVQVSKEVDLGILARGTTGFTGADLANMVNQAAIRAAADGAEMVCMEHFEYARDKIVMGTARKAMGMSDEEMRLTAFHEAGHALVALKTEHSMPIYKGTILPRGGSLGHVSFLPESDLVTTYKRDLLANMDVCMGGLVAEEMCTGKDSVTIGSGSDIQRATKTARDIVMRYCMSDKTGFAVHEENDKLSDHVKQQIDEEIKTVLKESYERAKDILTKYKHEHKLLAEALFKNETLDKEEMEQVIQGKTLVPKPH